ncbi:MULTISPECIES: phosphatase PAP2-related protein [unclassified Arcicella]|uniref:phosphatase PAP2-related protein n=1 Tax=unclassified Arcicella TaxID=2644986 RepID=UPI002861DBD6|nr:MULTISPECIES: phosphatase PAP2-related protein [unclassified Arcicella]MDR6563360.1 hypothetical protein [Arcicella sp. BE51]MDR6813219.1 hypothetical protein [Arcicella sp. BE140]MDR6824533.1 hypothetical protein [Arcicella sp. BE139]
MNDILTKSEPQKTSKSYFKVVQQRWKDAIQTDGFIIKLLTAVGIAFLAAPKFPSYFINIQKRDGAYLSDVVLNHIPAFDVSTPIFAIIYGMLVFLLCRVIVKPKLFLLFCLTFVIETVLRMSCIYFFPLNPPIGLVPLHDTFAELLIYGDTEPITKDLFFSGHTATMVMIWLFLEKRWEKTLAAIACITLAILLLVQHVHYTADVIGAFFFTALSYVIARYINKQKWPVTCGVILVFFFILETLFWLSNKII